MSTDQRCERCRARIIWAQTRPGLAAIALDPVPTAEGFGGVYEVDFDAMPVITARRIRGDGAPSHLFGPLYACHWDTCRAKDPEPAPTPAVEVPG